MNPQKIGRQLHAISRITLAVLLIVVIVAAVGGVVFVLRYNAGTPKTTSTPVTANTAAVPNLGNETWQFEGNSLHVYNYGWNGTIATFNTTVGGAVICPPTFYDGVLLVDLSNMTGMTPTGGVVAINTTNGQTVWTATVPNLMMTQPITYEGLVIIGLGNADFQNTTPQVRGNGTNYVAALNFSTGQVVWTFPTQGEDMPTPLIYNGLVIGANGNGMVYALNPLTGQEAWNVPLPSGSMVSMSSPALLGDSIFFGTTQEAAPGGAWTHSFFSVNLTDHQISWSTSLPAYGGVDDCSPAIWNDIVTTGYVVEASNGLQPILIGMNTTNGKILWQVDEPAGPEPGGEWFVPVTVWNGIVYSDSPEGGTLYAVNASSGTQLWAFSTGKDTSNVNVFDGNLWIVNSAGTLSILNPTTGTLLKSTNVGVPIGDGSVDFVEQSAIMWGMNGLVTCTPLSNIYPSN